MMLVWVVGKIVGSYWNRGQRLLSSRDLSTINYPLTVLAPTPSQGDSDERRKVTTSFKVPTTIYMDAIFSLLTT